MIHNQIYLTNRPVDQNKAFLRGLYSAPLENAVRWFDYLLGTTRQSDPEMTLDKFLQMLENPFLIVLQVNSPFPDTICYCANIRNQDRIDRFAWVKCSSSEQNYTAVSDLFKRVFGQNIEEIEVNPMVRAYHTT